MNTDVKCSIIEASSNELLYQLEVHNGLIPAYIVKKHDGPIPYIHKNERQQDIQHFFPSNAFMASARSSNTFNCMLQTRVNWLINANMAACRLGGFKSDLVYVFFLPTPSWLPPGRSTRSIACFKLGCKS